MSTRRVFLRQTGAAGVALLGGTLWKTAPAAARARRSVLPLDHIVVSCQENRAFDHYFGYAPAVQAKGYGPPKSYTLPDAQGKRHAPFHLTALSSPDPGHAWSDVHLQADGDKMDGFYKVLVHEIEGDTRGEPWYSTLTCLAVDKSAAAGSQVQPYEA